MRPRWLPCRVLGHPGSSTCSLATRRDALGSWWPQEHSSLLPGRGSSLTGLPGPMWPDGWTFEHCGHVACTVASKSAGPVCRVTRGPCSGARRRLECCSRRATRGCLRADHASLLLALAGAPPRGPRSLTSSGTTCPVPVSASSQGWLSGSTARPTRARWRRPGKWMDPFARLPPQARRRLARQGLARQRLGTFVPRRRGRLSE